MYCHILASFQNVRAPTKTKMVHRKIEWAEFYLSIITPRLGECPLLHCALAAAQCIVIGPVCGWVGVCVCAWVCYHDNSKLRASILTKLGLYR